MSLPEPVPPVIARALDRLTPTERELVEHAIEDGYATAELIAIALTEAGHPVSATTVRTYRRTIIDRKVG